MSERPVIRIGVLGCSKIAKKSVFQAINDSSFAQLAMIGSREVQNAEACAREFGCERFGTYEDVLENKDIDAVYISLPNTVHEEWVVKAANKGKHVWCEKPAALTYASAKRMLEACKKNNVRLMEGFMFRYHPQHKKVKDFIEEGALGELLRVEASFGFPMPAGGNIVNAELGGGAYYDACPYPMYASRMIFGAEPLRAVCLMHMDNKLRVPVNAEMILEYGNGKSALVSSRFGCYYQSFYRIVGTAGVLQTERAYPVLSSREVKLFLNRNDKEEIVAIAPADQFRLMIEDFCDEIVRGESGIRSYEKDLLGQARVLNAGMVSYVERRIVDLSEFA